MRLVTCWQQLTKSDENKPRCVWYHSKSSSGPILLLFFLLFFYLFCQPLDPLMTLTQWVGALRPRASTMVLREIKSQLAVSYRAGHVTKVLDQVSTQRTVQQGIPQWG